MTLQKFISDHENDDISRLLLSAGKWPEINVPLAATCIQCRRKLKYKVPSWYKEESLIYATALSAEQCSSEFTASVKADIASGLGIATMADLTGGMGIDSWCFSKKVAKVFYNEMNCALADAAKHNFRILGASGIEVSAIEITPDNLREFLSETHPDLVFLDPARRSSSGGKVFLIEDCRPDVLSLKDIILEQSRYMMVKLSPMADISACCGSLGPSCREVHVIGSGNECKELLVLLDREWSGDYGITVTDEESTFRFSPQEERLAVPRYAESADDISSFRYLYEPSRSMLKSGAFKILCERFPIVKLAPSTHLYCSWEPVSGMPSKRFVIEKSLPINRSSLKQVSAEYPESEVTARNIHMDTETLRKKLGLASGNERHIFGLGCGRAGDWLFICHRDI